MVAEAARGEGHGERGSTMLGVTLLILTAGDDILSSRGNSILSVAVTSSSSWEYSDGDNSPETSETPSSSPDSRR